MRKDTQLQLIIIVMIKSINNNNNNNKYIINMSQKLSKYQLHSRILPVNIPYPLPEAPRRGGRLKTVMSSFKLMQKKKKKLFFFF